MSKKFLTAAFAVSLLLSSGFTDASEATSVSSKISSAVTKVVDGTKDAANTAWSWTGGWAIDFSKAHPYYAGGAGLVAASLAVCHYAEDLGIELPDCVKDWCPCTKKKAKKAKATA